MPDPQFPTDMPAEPIPGYRLVKFLGRGGSGEVWEAVAPGGFRIALKFVSLGDRVGEQELRALEVVKGVRHANLLALFGTWEVAGRLAVAMELADRTLLDRLNEAKAHGQAGIPGPELLEYMREAAKGVDFLNEPRSAGGAESICIQHRDIKPQNLLLVGGSVKVGDYGLARVLEHTATGHSGGLTPAYAAPEFFEGRTTDRSDQYSLAVTYCHLRGGRRPFTGDAAALMAGHLHRDPDLTMLPPEEQPAVARALAKSPADRWPSCQAFVRALTAAGGPEQLALAANGNSSDEPAADPSDVVLRRLRAASARRSDQVPIRDRDWVLIRRIALGILAVFLVVAATAAIEGHVRIGAAISLGAAPFFGALLRALASPRLARWDAADLERSKSRSPGRERLHGLAGGVIACAVFLILPGSILGWALVINWAFPPAYHYRERGCTHFHSGRHGEALKDLNRAITLDRDDAKAYNCRAQVRAQLGALTEALADHNQAILLEPETAEFYTARAVTYDLKGEPQFAEQDRERARMLVGNR